ncbi:MAG: ribosome small subunit-dependent GTPase A [Chitinophagales bacterium]
MSSQLEEGVVVRGYGGFYYVLPASLAGEPVPCRVRGKLKRTAGRLLVGERVSYEPPEAPGQEGVIEAHLPRRSELERPPIANVDQLVAVMSAAKPPPDLLQVDRLLCWAGSRGLSAAVCLNKADLLGEAEADALLRCYREAGRPALAVSARTGLHLGELAALLKGRISVLAGRSGSGKTSLTNRLVPGRHGRTGEVSRKLGQGRQTTRHVELIVLPEGGLLADTPGFSSVEELPLTPEEVAAQYPEWDDLAAGCRFRGCLHDQEPGCAVKAAVAEGALSADRHRRYLMLLKEARERRLW